MLRIKKKQILHYMRNVSIRMTRDEQTTCLLLQNTYKVQYHPHVLSDQQSSPICQTISFLREHYFGSFKATLTEGC